MAGDGAEVPGSERPVPLVIIVRCGCKMPGNDGEMADRRSAGATGSVKT